jgi:alpha-L-rhamnosidase
MKNLKEYFITPEDKIKKKNFQPASYLRRVFSIEKDFKKVELHITACGLYQGYLNGESITNQLFLPGFTYYAKRLQFQTFNITKMINKGQNVLGVILGDGWYRGKIGVFSKRNFYGEKTKLALILEVFYTDGTNEIITTNNKWKATQNGPILKSDWKDGEIFDARKELEGWNEQDYNDDMWHNVFNDEYSGKIDPSEGVSVVEHERFKPDVLTTPDGSTVLDFKQNLFGYVEFSVKGKSGQRVKLTHGEVLDENGNFTLINLGVLRSTSKKAKPFQQVEYILKEGVQKFKPHFTAHGFRYVKLDNWPESVKPENFTSIAIYSDMEQTGFFECSHPLINQLVHNALWSQKSNFMEIPTDCPQRERAGWTGDISCYAPTASRLMNVNKFLAKWMKDLTHQQRDDGCVGSIVPAVGMPNFVDGAAGWADAAIIVPYVLYKTYDDKNILTEQYPSMVKWMKFLDNRAKKTHPSRWFKKNPYKKFTIDSGFHWGEWLEPGHVMGVDAVKGFFFPDFEVATAYYAYTNKLMSEIASILGKKEDSDRYQDLFEKIKKGYRYNFTKNGSIKSKRQCKYVRPIALDLISDEEKNIAIDKLNSMVINNEYKIGTGFLTTPYILQVLSDYGYVETAYKMLENEKRPGWLYEVKKGATTIWENWNGIDDNNVPRDSFNHYLMGSVVSWIFSHVAGIQPLEPGYTKIRIKPLPGGSLKYINCSYKSASGLIKSSWKRDAGNFSLEIDVPTETEVHLPDGTIHKVDKDIHQFSCKIQG